MSNAVFVTGAGMGIGRAIAVRLARDGAPVALLDRDTSALAETASEISQFGGRPHAIAVDLLDEIAVSRAFIDASMALGECSVLVNNVGQSARERAKPFWDGDPAVWDFTMAISLRTTLICTRQVLPGMRQRRYGRIINIASESAFYGHALTVDYSAAKAGVIGFTRGLASSVADREITVNAVCPGLVRTRVMDALPREHINNLAAAIPMGRIGEPEEIAAAVAFFAHPSSRCITGQSLLVNGGRWMI